MALLRATRCKGPGARLNSTEPADTESGRQRDTGMLRRRKLDDLSLLWLSGRPPRDKGLDVAYA